MADQQKISASYPAISFKEFSLQQGNENVDNTFTYKFEFLCLEKIDQMYLVTTGFDELFIDLINQVTSNQYIEELGRALQMDLSDKKCVIEFTRYRPGDWLDAHYDKQTNKILTQIFYFNTNWDVKWGGYFEMLNPQDIKQTILTIPPLINYSIIVKPSSQAWHQVTPVHPSALQARLNMAVEFYDRVV